jgi:prepilin-type N-terminal cleavage/methylation domain-containing protein
MFRILKNKQRGFTLIELMIVVAIIGILAAVAIPTFMDMMKKSKRSEAEVNLNAITKGAKAYYVENAGYPSGEGAGELVPETECCEADNRKCPPDADQWKGDADAPTVWDNLDFTVDEPSFFQYSYESDDDGFTAKAVGDLDCDGTAIEYTMVGDENNGNPLYTLTKPARAD